MLVFVVARPSLDRYEELRQHFAGWREVRVILDRREADRRTVESALSGADRRRAERRRRPQVRRDLSRLGWAVIHTDELAEGN
jgi:hypothetical protein